METAACWDETIVFTGELAMPRELAADWRLRPGADVIPNPTKKMTMLVVGERAPHAGLGGKKHQASTR
jgi:NAD-dependent DNA ligase